MKRIPLIDGAEHDALTSWRKVLKFRSGERKAIKRQYNRRFRKAAAAVMVASLAAACMPAADLTVEEADARRKAAYLASFQVASDIAELYGYEAAAIPAMQIRRINAFCIARPLAILYMPLDPARTAAADRVCALVR